MNETLRLLIVDDDEVDRMAIRRALTKTNLTLAIAEASNAATALETIAATNPAAEPETGDRFTWILVDYQLPDLDGLALVSQLRGQGVLVPIIVLTGQGDEQIAVSLMKAGASDYLVKDQLSPDLLTRHLHNTLKIYRAEQQAMEARAELQRTNVLLKEQNQALAAQQQRIEEANHQLREANRQKSTMMQQRDDFVARLTHDLRTPLIAANRMLKFCQDEAFGTVAPEAQEAIANVISNNDHLLHMVNSLLDVYRHEAGEKKLIYGDCNLLDLAQTVVQDMSPLAQEKDLVCAITSTTLEQSPDIFQLEADAQELRRILTNLVGNAIKFTDRGSIHLALKPLAASQLPETAISQGSNIPPSWLSLAVQDTGMGISETDQATIFDWFRQGQTLRAGSGLGLHLAQRIAKLHGGFIGLESYLHQGSTFTLYIPRVAPTPCLRR